MTLAQQNIGASAPRGPFGLARLGMVWLIAFALTALGGGVGCESAADRRTQESGLELWATPADGSWMISFVGIRGHASDVVVRFGDERKETYRRPSFQLPPDIEGPIDIWLLEYKLQGETVRGPFRFRFDPRQEQIDGAKDALDMLGNQWVEWKRWGKEDILYTSFITRYTCAFERVQYGFEDEPELDLPMPPCKMSELNWADKSLSFPANAHDHVVVRITYADGEKSSVHRFANPNFGTPAADVSAASVGGAVTMEVTPRDARVVVDGRPVEGESPFIVSDLRVGKHAVTVKKDGYETLQAEFELSSASMHMRFKLDAEGTDGPVEGR